MCLGFCLSDGFCFCLGGGLGDQRAHRLAHEREDLRRRFRRDHLQDIRGCAPPKIGRGDKLVAEIAQRRSVAGHRVPADGDPRHGAALFRLLDAPDDERIAAVECRARVGGRAVPAQRFSEERAERGRALPLHAVDRENDRAQGFRRLRGMDGQRVVGAARGHPGNCDTGDAEASKETLHQAFRGNEASFRRNLIA
ncbi:MAG: hypothetical protein EXQ86_06965 [Rhodospirillales bacterium]|nr:hypothetical protein [Rhodospirillales bacterium]